MESPLRCSVVIPHLRGTHQLLACLQALLHGDPPVEVLLIDNASDDGSVDAARSAYPLIRVIRAAENLGYAGAANLGLAEAGTPFCIFLNDDALFAPGALDALLACLESAEDGEVLVQPTLRRSDDPQRFDYAGGAGGLQDRWGYTFALGRLFDSTEMDEGQYRMSGPLAWASGCCLAGPTSVFRDLGGFESSFFAHFEEIDLCWRHRRLGGTIVSCPDAIVYHMGPSTLPVGARKTYLNFRNNLWTLRRNLPLRRRALVILARLPMDAAAAARWLVKGRFAEAFAVLRGWIAGLLRRPWSEVIPPPHITAPGADMGTYRGNAAVAYFLKGIRRASDLLPHTIGWEEGTRERGR